MKRSVSNWLRAMSMLGTSAALVSTGGLFATQPSFAQPSASTSLCSRGAQSCSVSPATAILTGGPLSVSASESSLEGTSTTREVVFSNTADSINEQTNTDNAPVGLDLGPLEINPRSPGIGVRDVQD